jgi:SAM-dependent methyltransferase
MNWQRVRDELLPRPDAFDCEWGVDTAGIKSLVFRRVLRGNSRSCTRYEPVNADACRAVVRRLPRWKFVDLGCGKGRALIIAHQEGFTDLVGVDFSSALCRAARRNLDRLGVTASVLTMDARTFVFPQEPSVVFLYNPFGPGILRDVLRNAASQQPRIFVYVNPLHETVFGRLTLVRSGHKLRVFANDAALAAAVPAWR